MNVRFSNRYLKHKKKTEGKSPSQDATPHSDAHERSLMLQILKTDLRAELDTRKQHGTSTIWNSS